jgi:hypothetical protein
MKKQTQSITTTTTRPAIKKIELIFLVVIATIIYRNQSNRTMPSMPPNSLGLVKTALVNFFYHVNVESLVNVAIAMMLVLLIVAIVYIIRTH